MYYSHDIWEKNSKCHCGKGVYKTGRFTTTTDKICIQPLTRLVTLFFSVYVQVRKLRIFRQIFACRHKLSLHHKVVLVFEAMSLKLYWALYSFAINPRNTNTIAIKRFWKMAEILDRLRGAGKPFFNSHWFYCGKYFLKQSTVRNSVFRLMFLGELHMRLHVKSGTLTDAGNANSKWCSNFRLLERYCLLQITIYRMLRSNWIAFFL